MKLKTIFLIILMMITAGMANAEEEKSLRVVGEAGLLMTRGNSVTDSVSGKLSLKYEKDHFLSEVNLAALYRSETTEIEGEKEDTVSAEKYNYSAKIGYKFDKANYAFLNADYENDRFSGYDYKTTYSVGYGRKVIDSDTTKFDIEIGPGYRYDRTSAYREDNVFIDEEAEDELILRGYAMFNYKISKAVSFQQDITVVTGSDNTNTKSVTALKSQIVGALAMKVSFKVDSNTDVPPGKVKTDTETALTLVYDF